MGIFGLGCQYVGLKLGYFGLFITASVLPLLLGVITAANNRFNSGSKVCFVLPMIDPFSGSISVRPRRPLFHKSIATELLRATMPFWVLKGLPLHIDSSYFRSQALLAERLENISQALLESDVQESSLAIVGPQMPPVTHVLALCWWSWWHFHRPTDCLWIPCLSIRVVSHHLAQRTPCFTTTNHQLGELCV